METIKGTLFPDRTYAAFLLEEPLRSYRNSTSIVLAIPRGGVTIGFHLARLLHLPLDLIMCKKIGHPSNSEYAIGAVSTSCVTLDKSIKGISEKYLNQEISRIQKSLHRRYQKLTGKDSPESLADKNVIIVDDGIATGNTVLACLKEIRKQKPKKIIVAVPVISMQASDMLAKECDELISLATPPYFNSVGQYYENFLEVSDEDVVRMINKLTHERVEAT